MKSFFVGQRWVSESEPELGLGIILENQNKTIVAFFPATQVERRYGIQTAPLRRIRFSKGDEIRLQDGTQHEVVDTREEQNILIYSTTAGEFKETLLADTISLARPEERLFLGHADSNQLFKLRYDLLLHQRNLYLSPVRGFLGGRLKLIPHQCYVAQEITSRLKPRVMLSDEVGLGKTIEAGMILHQLLLTGKADRVLILVPDSLVYQWFVEMLKKFGLSFATINHETKLEEGENPFENNQLFIVSLRFLMQKPSLVSFIENDNWDMVVVDEAHQLKWSPTEASQEYELVEKIGRQSEGLILLSGTPEILGLAGHYARLRLLDPERFFDYNTFLEEHSGYQEISSIAKFLLSEKALTAKQQKKLTDLGLGIPEDKAQREKTLGDLLDRHGTGRVFFRNTRQRMASFAEFFPKRVLHAAPLDAASGKNSDKKDYTAKVLWLTKFLGETAGTKTLLLCHDKDLVLALESSLKNLSPAKVAVFHAGLPLLHRDRAAAWFADPEGAQLLLSTEAGSEGRNFEFAQHLILFDLPRLPDLLEQRIGRLDRIGQKNDINIHVPYLVGSGEEVLFRWYHEGLNAFESSPRGASELYAGVREELIPFLDGDFDEKAFAKFIKRTREAHAEIEERLEEGQDLLVDLNSFNEKRAMDFIGKLKATEASPDLKNFMNSIFELLGVETEDLDGKSTYVRPGDNMSIPHFPGLPHEGVSITYEREVALARPDLLFLTWDHPMVLGIMDFIASNETGNITVASFKTKAPEPFMLEVFFTLQCLADKALQAHQWFPPTPLRVLLNGKAQDLTPKYPKKMIDDNVATASPDKIAQLKELPRDITKGLLASAKQTVMPRAKQYKEKFLTEMETFQRSEITRLKQLREINPTISKAEIKALEQRLEDLKAAMNDPQLTLDSIRVIM